MSEHQPPDDAPEPTDPPPEPSDSEQSVLSPSLRRAFEYVVGGEIMETHAALIAQGVREEFLRLRAEESGHSTEHCVDTQILAELGREWDRSDPPNPFGLLERLKQEDARHWVSPEVSLRMLAAVEYVARTAYNEATRF